MKDPVAILIVGGNGQLGSMVSHALVPDPRLCVRAIVRDPGIAERLRDHQGWAGVVPMDVTDPKMLEQYEHMYGPADLIINCAGAIKPRLVPEDMAAVRRGLQANVFLPQMLYEQAERWNARVIQIATDCVYSGQAGPYREEDPHDATDLYGKTKSLGEIANDQVKILRCSIVGPEIMYGSSLLEWFLRQPRGARLQGFTDHRWNGVTTLAFARVIQAFLDDDSLWSSLPPVIHLVPQDVVTKHTLLELFAQYFGREDLDIRPVPSGTPVDRSLATGYPELLPQLWKHYRNPPKIETLIEELAGYCKHEAPYHLRYQAGIYQALEDRRTAG